MHIYFDMILGILGYYSVSSWFYNLSYTMFKSPKHHMKLSQKCYFINYTCKRLFGIVCHIIVYFKYKTHTTHDLTIWELENYSLEYWKQTWIQKTNKNAVFISAKKKVATVG